MVKRVFEDGEIEIRQVFQVSDFGPALTPDLKEAEERAQVAAKKSLNLSISLPFVLPERKASVRCLRCLGKGINGKP